MKTVNVELGKHYVIIDSPVPFYLESDSGEKIYRPAGCWQLDCWQLLTKEYFKNYPVFTLDILYDDTKGTPTISYSDIDLGTGLAGVNGQTVTVSGIDELATETTLSSLGNKLATETTLSSLGNKLATEATLSSLGNKLATEATLSSLGNGLLHIFWEEEFVHLTGDFRLVSGGYLEYRISGQSGFSYMLEKDGFIRLHDNKVDLFFGQRYNNATSSFEYGGQRITGPRTLFDLLQYTGLYNSI